ncbi:hypothetical protein [Streptomyces fuscichromogenes]|uniref:Uncharacterized protein n=1 Tax=Streptomyces fuscichromogenes TaxID=1324013 RepID=A0A917UEU5_9ACTN|nr:hypothetical protein [Streptomyces fuscichromogenes]GGM86133.1 hypothetical protein GCM10011578_001160 [Streptomyces fuscichromogenes]
MTVDKPASEAEGPDTPPIPWFGPTLHELVPGSAPGVRLPVLRRQMAQALVAAHKDQGRQEAIRRADRASRGPVASLVADMLTPPLSRPDTTEERP